MASAMEIMSSSEEECGAIPKTPKLARTPPQVSRAKYDEAAHLYEKTKDKRVREEEKEEDGVVRDRESKRNKAGGTTPCRDQDRVAQELRRRERELQKKHLETEALLEKERKTREAKENRRKAEHENSEEKIAMLQSSQHLSQRFVDIQRNLTTITELVSKEASGKISVTRADQQAIKQSVIDVQRDIISYLVENVITLREKAALQERIWQLEARAASTEREMNKEAVAARSRKTSVGVSVSGSDTREATREEERVSHSRKGAKTGDKGGWRPAATRGNRQNQLRKDYGGEETTDMEDDTLPRGLPKVHARMNAGMNGRENMPRVRTYADATQGNRQGEVRRGNAGKRQEIIGRVVQTGKEGWKTPPHREVDEIVITSTTEKDARRLASELARAINVKEIGGAPQSVFRHKDGGVAIFPKNNEQGKLLTAAVEKKGEWNVRQKHRAEPMLRLSGVEKETTNEEIVERLLRQVPTYEQPSTIKVVKRIERASRGVRVDERMIVEDESLSDHRYVSYKIQCARKSECRREKGRRRHVVEGVNWSMYGEELKKNWGRYPPSGRGNVDEAAIRWQKLVLDTADQCLLNIGKRKKERGWGEWWTIQLQVHRSRVRRLRMKAQEARGLARELAMEEWRSMRSDYKKAIRMARHVAFEGWLDSCPQVLPIG